MRAAWGIIKQAIGDFVGEDAMAWAAAVAFYAALSFSPIIVLLVTIGSWLGRETQTAMIDEVKTLMGEHAAQMVEQVVASTREDGGSGVLAFVLSVGVTLFSASGVFAQLQLSLNHIWHVQVKPDGLGIKRWAVKRLLSIGMVGALAFLLLVSLVASAVVDYVAPSGAGWARVGSMAVSLVVYVPLFMMIFRVLPDAKLAWRDVAFGAAVTAVLFLVGKEVIGLYLGHSAVGSAYGAAGALVVLLVWVYYSAIILLLGAEITQAYVQHAGRQIEPESHAEAADDADKAKD